jgi:hypothetical protein
MHRNRIVYLCCTFIVVVIGLASRKFPELIPTVLGKYPGDALWALMLFLGLGIFFPKVSTRRLALITLGISFIDEFSQMYQSPWINSIRATTLGHLVLGSSFCFFDLLAYILGILIGVICECVYYGSGLTSGSS